MAAAAAPPVPEISIDISKDLDSLSDLKELVSKQSNAIFKIGAALAQFAGQPVSAAASASAGASLDLTATLPSWTAGPVSFSLKPEAKCTISIAAKGESLPVALKVDSTDTTDVQLAPAAGMTYINIDLDFDISGSASGQGTVEGISISGKASGSANTTLSFCQAVPSTTETLAALRAAFSAIVFPTSPDCLLRMKAGSSARMNFDGTLNWELDASYGLGSYKLSASDASSVLASIQKRWDTTVTLPTATVNVGATASVKYAHTDHFGLVITIGDAKQAMLYLVRSDTNDTTGTVGISVGIKTTDASVTLNTAALTNTVQSVTGSSAIATSVATQLANPVNNLYTAATKKLNSWISDVNGTTGLSWALEQQTGRTTLYNFAVDLTSANLDTTWKALLSSNIQNVQRIPGFTPQAGSGVAEHLTRTATFQFNFFNFYQYKNQSDYFNNCTAELNADGTIRLYYDIGVEDIITTKVATGKIRIHFTGTATDDTNGNINNAEIDLNIELSEKGDSKGAIAMAKVLTPMKLPQLQPAINAMNLYAQTNPGTLSLMATLKPTAYGRLAFSPYAGSKPAADQTKDAWNWDAIRDATFDLMSLDYVQNLTYTNWSDFCSLAVTGSLGSPGDRHALANALAIVPSIDPFWNSIGIDSTRAPFVTNFFVASAGGMNLFEDLVTLATDVPNVTTTAQWAAIQADVALIVKGDMNIDYSKPITAAILAQVAHSGAQTTVTVSQAGDNSTCTVTLTVG